VCANKTLQSGRESHRRSFAEIPKELLTGCDDESRKAAWSFSPGLSPLIAIDKGKFLCHIVKAVSRIA